MRRLAWALGLLAVGCGPDPLLGAWQRSTPTGMAEAAVGDPLVGTWRGTPRLKAEEGTLEVLVALHDDGTFWRQELATSPVDAEVRPGCAQQIVWTGRYTNDSPGRLTLEASTEGARTRSGCLDPAEDGVGVEPRLDGGVGYSLFTDRLPDPVYELTLTPDGQDPAQAITLTRVDVTRDRLTLNLTADTWALQHERVYAAQAHRYAGCRETVELTGRFLRSGTVDGTLRFSPGEQAIRQRQACLAPADEGEVPVAAEEALGALAGAHLYDFPTRVLWVEVSVEETKWWLGFEQGSAER